MNKLSQQICVRCVHFIESIICHLHETSTTVNMSALAFQLRITAFCLFVNKKWSLVRDST